MLPCPCSCRWSVESTLRQAEVEPKPGAQCCALSNQRTCISVISALPKVSWRKESMQCSKEDTKISNIRVWPLMTGVRLLRNVMRALVVKVVGIYMASGYSARRTLFWRGRQYSHCRIPCIETCQTMDRIKRSSPFYLKRVLLLIMSASVPRGRLPSCSQSATVIKRHNIPRDAVHWL